MPHRSQQGNMIVTRPLVPEFKLKNLGRLALFLNKHRGDLIETYTELELRIADLVADGYVPDALFGSLMDANQHMISTGGLSAEEGLAQVVDLMLKHSEYHEKRRGPQQEWFKRWYGGTIDDELLEQVIRWVERRIRKESGVV